MKKRGWEVNYRGRLESTDARGSAAQRKFDQTKQAQLQKIRELRDRALLDLIDMEPKAQKRYYIRLKQQLAQV